MPDLTLRDLDASLLERVRRWADAQGTSLDSAAVALLARGLAASADIVQLEELDARVLAEAIVALENIPSDPGFALIGRAAQSPPPRHSPELALTPGLAPSS